MNRQIAGWIAHRWAKWVVFVLAFLVVGGFASMAGKLTGVQENDIGAWLPGDAESTKVIEKLGDFGQSDLIPLVVLYTNDSGITGDDWKRAAADITQFTEVESVQPNPAGPVPSDDGDALEVILQLKMSSEGWEILPDVVDDVRTIAEKDAGGLDVHLAGPAALGADQAEAFAGIDGILLFSALGVVIVMLLLTYRSPILWVIPLLTGVMAVGMSQGVVYLLAKYADLTVNGQSAGILSVLVLGAGTDYALLLIARYREELHNFEDRHEAMAHALHRAAPAIIASGATVIIGMLCLLFAQMNSTASLGPVAATGIAVSLFLMLTMLPALLVIFGRWVFWPYIPRFGTPVPTERGIWARVGTKIAKAPRVTWIVTTVILGALALGIFQLGANGLTNEQAFTKEQPSIVAEKLAAKHFPAGGGSPVMVLSDEAEADAVKSAFQSTEGIAAGTVAQLGPAVKGTVFLQGTLESASDSTEAFDTVDRVRDAVHAVDGANAVVGGDTAINHDVQDASAADNTLIIPIVLVAVLLILGVLLRSIVAPAILLATVVLSFAAALGISALTFKHVFGFEGADSSFPLFVFIFLVALGIDYNIFLMTRVREEALIHGTKKGALIGLAATGGVITSAGLVLAGTFGALATLPMVFMAELGFAVAIGVLLDTIIVRSVLVTALNLDVGKKMWWYPGISADAPIYSRD